MLAVTLAVFVLVLYGRELYGQFVYRVRSRSATYIKRRPGSPGDSVDLRFIEGSLVVLEVLEVAVEITVR